MPANLREWRCSCGKLLFKGDYDGWVEIKCLRCGQIKAFHEDRHERTDND